MSGSQTKGFDAVLELAEPVLADAVTAYLTYDGMLCRLGDHMIAQLLEQLSDATGVPDDSGGDGSDDLPDIGGIVDDLTGQQQDHLTGVLDGTLPRPSFLCFPDEIVSITAEVEPPPGTTFSGDTVTITAFVRGEHEVALRLDLVVGIQIRTVEDTDTVVLDFDDGLEHASATLTVAGTDVALEMPQIVAVLGDLMEPLPLLPIPVDGASEDPTVIKAVDVFTIDDTFAADRDALALGLTFGGGSPGTPADFDRAVIPEGSTGALMMSNEWLCRLVGPRIEDELGLEPTELTTDGCTWEGSSEVEVDGDSLTLTRVSLSARDGYLSLDMHLEKDEGCSHSEVDAEVRITAGIVGGELVLDAEVMEPSVDNDTPWWCWLVGLLVGAVVGGLLGALAGGWIGAIVGAVVGAVVGVVVVFLIDIVSDPVGNLAGELGDLISNTVSGLRVTAPVLSIVPVDAFIDDVTVGLDVRANLPYPIRLEGESTLRAGQGLDLDRGAVLPEDAGGVDVVVVPVATTVQVLFFKQTVHQARLEAVCGAALAPSGSYAFDAMGRLQVGRLPYVTNGVVAPRQITSFVDVAAAAFGPTRQVIGVRTNEGRYGILQVTGLRAGEVDVRWRTWESPSGNVRIAGGFACRGMPGLGVTATALARRQAGSVDWRVAQPAGEAARRFAGGAAGPAGSRQRYVRRAWLQRSRTGRFEAVLDRPTAVATAAWRLDGTPLAGGSGTVRVDGRTVEFETSGDGLRLTLRLTGDDPLSAWLEVDVETRGAPAHSAVCLDWEPTCELVVAGVPPLAEWWRLARPHLGVIPVDRDDDAAEVTFAGPAAVSPGTAARPPAKGTTAG